MFDAHADYSASPIGQPASIKLSFENYPCLPLLQAPLGNIVFQRYQNWIHGESNESALRIINHQSTAISTISYDSRSIPQLSDSAALLSYSVEAVGSSRCMSSGFIRIIDAAASSAVAIDSIPIQPTALAVINVICEALMETLAASEMEPSTLRFVKCFVPQQHQDVTVAGATSSSMNLIEAMRSALSQYTFQIISGAKIDFIELPYKQHDNSRNALAVQYFAADLLQIKTEMWIRGD